jgi:hypothetical protein
MAENTVESGLALMHGSITREIIGTRILPLHEAQLLNYLKATGINVGLILNFGSQPGMRRMLLTPDRRVVRAGDPWPLP